MTTIKVEKSPKAYGKDISIDSVSFEVQKGEILDMVA